MYKIERVISSSRKLGHKKRSRLAPVGLGLVALDFFCHLLRDCVDSHDCLAVFLEHLCNQSVPVDSFEFFLGGVYFVVHDVCFCLFDVSKIQLFFHSPNKTEKKIELFSPEGILPEVRVRLVPCDGVAARIYEVVEGVYRLVELAAVLVLLVLVVA